MSIRLFVGNLDISVQAKNLQKKFSSYGVITACDLKEKKDVDGNVISKFGYVSYDANENRISDCKFHITLYSVFKVNFDNTIVIYVTFHFVF